MDKEKYVAGAKIDSLTGLCDNINEVLDKALSISYDLVGMSDISKSEAVEEPKSKILTLHNQLLVIHARAQTLLNQLEHIAIQI